MAGEVPDVYGRSVISPQGFQSVRLVGRLDKGENPSSPLRFAGDHPSLGPGSRKILEKGNNTCHVLK
jgi:hypothetical protein